MLTAILKKQFDAAFSIIEAAIPSFSPEQWRRGCPAFNGPARVVAHVLQCAIFYPKQDKSIFGTMFGKPVWQMEDAETPSQQALLACLAEARRETTAWLEGIADDDVKAVDLAIYALRHLQHHTGELCAYQKQCGLEPAQWA